MGAMTAARHRSTAIAQRLIGISISYERDPLLARGLGLEHLRELLVRLARPLLRAGANIAFAGGWQEREDNFTYELLRLISAEQEDNSLGGPDTNLTIGRLLNHSSWPVYLQITPRVEAQWIHCCHIVRITQPMAGIAAANVVADDAAPDDPRRMLNAAVTLSAMRRLATDGMLVQNRAVPTPTPIPPLSARVMLGGKLTGYQGFMPGVLEEARLAMQSKVPLYVLGGFGGASEVLARALLAPAGQAVPELEAAWHFERTPALARLRDEAAKSALPPGTLGTGDAFAALASQVQAARAALGQHLNTGLDEALTKEMMSTSDARRAVELVLIGLSARLGFQVLPT